MKTELIDQMAQVGRSFDVETWKGRAKFVPPLVCGSLAVSTGARILDKAEARAEWLKLLEPGLVEITAFGAFDNLVMIHDLAKQGHDPIELMEAVFAKYDRGEIYDVLIAEALDAIYGGHLGLDPRTGGQLRHPTSNKVTQHYSLAVVCDLTFGYRDAKENDAWRTSYALLDDVPISEWPEAARTYPVDDTVNTLIACLVQCGFLGRDGGKEGLKTGPRRRADNLCGMADIARASWALHLGAQWGFGVDQKAVAHLKATIGDAIEAGAERFKQLGLVVDDGGKLKKPQAPKKRRVAVAHGAKDPCPRCNGVGKVPSPKTGKPINCKNMMIERAPGVSEQVHGCDGTGFDLEPLGAILPRTDGGGVSTGRDILVDSGDDTLIEFAAWDEQSKIVTTYIPALEAGLPMRPNVPLNNLRVSYGGIVQTMPRKGAVRDCVEARPATLLSSNDFSGVELCTVSQACIWILGYSTLGEALNRGEDVHCTLGADVCGITYDEFYTRLKAGERMIGDQRQGAKPGNFGFWGGMGAATFVITNRKAPGMTTTSRSGRVYRGVRFCLLIGGAEECGTEKITEWKGRPTKPVCSACVEAANTVREVWFSTWRETRPYFKYMSDVVDAGGAAKQFGTGTVRGGMTFTQAANDKFSSLAAWGTKKAFYEVQKRAYCARPADLLYGTRAIAFIHDEAVCEHPIDRAAEAATEVGNIMRGVMQECVPDIKIRTEPALMRRYYKGAEAVFDGAGNLIPWEP